ncbi:hypothetical protein Pst134EB_016550 [Puccinia striiformis f. sp. tritici]|uniref:Uncharacterized protein n=1 Tax=Puccinia striiformis f. sp. tritici PST-78 TaxID=1165861 RepID=A0A0L0VG20_9BASI|nr:hypothetical protein Pst134EB_016550 [Puccinia striiformis f. sp. tritici]KNE98245.1 hypothetical protein PSTG_08516 [Puccinia striiformis f. sp. tritici PST-78]
MQKITARLNSIEKSINTGPTNNKEQTFWATVTKKSIIPSTKRPTTRPPPTTRVINEFKPSFFIIRKTGADARPFFQRTPKNIIEKVNSVLKEIEAKTDDGTPITIKGAVVLQSGDSLITPQSTFPVILNTVPISFTPTHKSTIKELCEQNEGMKPELIHSIRWLGNPQEDKKKHGSLVMNLLDKDTCKKIERGGLFFDGLYFSGTHYKKAPLQCFQCLGFSHTAQYCKNKPMCKICGDEHNSKDCTIDDPTTTCVKCIQKEKTNHPEKEVDSDNIRFAHSPQAVNVRLKLRISVVIYLINE